ncbi:exophilin-5 [Discoglossus pictus]
MTRAAPGRLDLSFLQEEEANKILEVLQRDEKLRRAERERVGKLQRQHTKRDLKWLHGVTGEWFEEIQRKKFKNDPDVRSLLQQPLNVQIKPKNTKEDPEESIMSRSRNVQSPKSSTTGPSLLGLRSPFASLFSFRKSIKQSLKPEPPPERHGIFSIPTQRPNNTEEKRKFDIYSSTRRVKQLASLFEPRHKRENESLPINTQLEKEAFQVLGDLDQKLAQEQRQQFRTIRTSSSYRPGCLDHQQGSLSKMPEYRQGYNITSFSGNEIRHAPLTEGRKTYATFQPRKFYEMYSNRQRTASKQHKNTFEKSPSWCSAYGTVSPSTAPDHGTFSTGSLQHPAMGQQSGLDLERTNQHRPRRTPISAVKWGNQFPVKPSENRDQISRTQSAMDLTNLDSSSQKNRMYNLYKYKKGYRETVPNTNECEKINYVNEATSQLFDKYSSNGKFGTYKRNTSSFTSTSFPAENENNWVGQNKKNTPKSNEVKMQSFSDLIKDKQQVEPMETDFGETNNTTVCSYQKSANATFTIGNKENVSYDFQMQSEDNSDLTKHQSTVNDTSYINQESIMDCNDSSMGSSSGTENLEEHMQLERSPKDEPSYEVPKPDVPNVPFQSGKFNKYFNNKPTSTTFDLPSLGHNETSSPIQTPQHTPLSGSLLFNKDVSPNISEKFSKTDSSNKLTSVLFTRPLKDNSSLTYDQSKSKDVDDLVAIKRSHTLHNSIPDILEKLSSLNIRKNNKTKDDKIQSFRSDLLKDQSKNSSSLPNLSDFRTYLSDLRTRSSKLKNINVKHGDIDSNVTQGHIAISTPMKDSINSHVNTDSTVSQGHITISPPMKDSINSHVNTDSTVTQGQITISPSMKDRINSHIDTDSTVTQRHITISPPMKDSINSHVNTDSTVSQGHITISPSMKDRINSHIDTDSTVTQRHITISPSMKDSINSHIDTDSTVTQGHITISPSMKDSINSHIDTDSTVTQRHITISPSMKDRINSHINTDSTVTQGHITISPPMKDCVNSHVDTSHINSDVSKNIKETVPCLQKPYAFSYEVASSKKNVKSVGKSTESKETAPLLDDILHTNIHEYALKKLEEASPGFENKHICASKGTFAFPKKNAADTNNNRQSIRVFYASNNGSPLDSVESSASNVNFPFTETLKDSECSVSVLARPHDSHSYMPTTNKSQIIQNPYDNFGYEISSTKQELPVLHQGDVSVTSQHIKNEINIASMSLPDNFVKSVSVNNLCKVANFEMPNKDTVQRSIIEAHDKQEFPSNTNINQTLIHDLQKYANIRETRSIETPKTNSVSTFPGERIVEEQFQTRSLNRAASPLNIRNKSTSLLKEHQLLAPEPYKVSTNIKENVTPQWNLPASFKEATCPASSSIINLPTENSSKSENAYTSNTYKSFASFMRNTQVYETATKSSETDDTDKIEYHKLISIYYTLPRKFSKRSTDFSLNNMSNIDKTLENSNAPSALLEKTRQTEAKEQTNIEHLNNRKPLSPYTVDNIKDTTQRKTHSTSFPITSLQTSLLNNHRTISEESKMSTSDDLADMFSSLQISERHSDCNLKEDLVDCQPQTKYTNENRLMDTYINAASSSKSKCNYYTLPNRKSKFRDFEKHLLEKDVATVHERQNMYSPTGNVHCISQGCKDPLTPKHLWNNNLNHSPSSDFTSPCFLEDEESGNINNIIMRDRLLCKNHSVDEDVINRQTVPSIYRTKSLKGLNVHDSYTGRGQVDSPCNMEPLVYNQSNYCNIEQLLDRTRPCIGAKNVHKDITAPRNIRQFKYSFENTDQRDFSSLPYRDSYSSSPRMSDDPDSPSVFYSTSDNHTNHFAKHFPGWTNSQRYSESQGDNHSNLYRSKSMKVLGEQQESTDLRSHERRFSSKSHGGILSSKSPSIYVESKNTNRNRRFSAENVIDENDNWPSTETSYIHKPVYNSKSLDYGIFGKEQQAAFLNNIKRTLTEGRLWRPSFLKNPGFLRNEENLSSNDSQFVSCESQGTTLQGPSVMVPLNIYQDKPVICSDSDNDTTTDDEYYLDENDKESEL